MSHYDVQVSLLNIIIFIACIAIVAVCVMYLATT